MKQTLLDIGYYYLYNSFIYINSHIIIALINVIDNNRYISRNHK